MPELSTEHSPPVCCVISKLALTSAEIIDHAASANDDDDDDTPQDSGAREQGSNLIGTSTSGARSSVFALDNMLAPVWSRESDHGPLTAPSDPAILEMVCSNIFGGKQDEISILTVSISVIVTHSRCTFLCPNGW